jgi:hypothetical protein
MEIKEGRIRSPPNPVRRWPVDVDFLVSEGVVDAWTATFPGAPRPPGKSETIFRVGAPNPATH